MQLQKCSDVKIIKHDPNKNIKGPKDSNLDS